MHKLKTDRSCRTGLSGTLMLILTLLTVGCVDTTPPAPDTQSTATSHDSQFIAMLSKLRSKNPVENARSAISTGQPFFLCNAGRSSTVPGLNSEDYQAVQANCPTKCLEGVTDALHGPNHAQYLSAALDYSAKWNQTMLSACR